ncbi:hypothetical protein D3C81_2156100 [compost metagenome]
MNCAAVAGSIDVREAGLHVVIHDNRAVRKHIHFALQQFRIRTESIAEDHQICLVLAFAGDYLRYFAVLSCE